jgi:hypothetical protein
VWGAVAPHVAARRPGSGGRGERARSEHLPIYKRSYDLCLYLEQVVAGFPRYHKYAVGADLRDGARRVLRGVVRANSAADKPPLLRELRLEIEERKRLCRLACDLQAFSSLRRARTRAGTGRRRPSGLRTPAIRTTRGTRTSTAAT